MKKALIIVDEQNDFCEGGALAVPGGVNVCRRTAQFLNSEWQYNKGIHHLVVTQDWHMTPGKHFSGKPDYVDTWPPHCVAGTRGAKLHASVRNSIDNWHYKIFRKGMTSAAYSGFEAVMVDQPAHMGNGPIPQPELVCLDWYLKDMDISHVYICGLATDYCVKATALDAVDLGYQVTLLTDLMAAVDPTHNVDSWAEDIEKELSDVTEQPDNQI